VTIAAAPLARFPLSDTLSDKDMRPRVVLDRVVTCSTRPGGTEGLGHAPTCGS